MQRIGLTGLIKIELPAQTVLLCDGGFIDWNADTFRSRDPLFGTVLSLESLEEGVGDEVPALEMELAPPSTAAVADLSQPGYQRSRARFWVAEYDVDAGTVLGTPELQFDGQIDQTTLRVGRQSRSLSTTIVSTAEVLFERDQGNSQSSAFHQSIWPGEKGHDNGRGLKVPIAWGVEGPKATGFGSGGGGNFTPGRGIKNQLF